MLSIDHFSEPVFGQFRNSKRVQTGSKNDHFLEIFVVFINFWILILASSGIVNTYKRIQKWSLCHVFEYFWIRILAGSGIVNMYKRIQKWSLCHVFEYFWILILASSGIVNMYKRSKSCSFPRNGVYTIGPSGHPCPAGVI